jgi:hypothetical protein
VARHGPSRRGMERGVPLTRHQAAGLGQSAKAVRGTGED